MGRDFLKLKIDSKKIYPLILGAGFLTAVLMGLASWKESRLENRALVRNMTGEGSYEQELTARTGTYGKIPLTVTVEERRLSEREAEEELARAEELLPELLMGENESLRAVTHDLNFAEEVPGTLVEADWQTGALEYFTADGKLRKEVRVTEPVVIQISAVLSCQDKVRDFKTEITLIPREETAAERLGAMVADSSIKTMESAELPLPEQYEGEEISWRKPMDMTFLYLLLMIPAAAVFLKLGEKRDRDLEKQKIREELDGDYAGLVGKFTMLLAAGMSIRSAWERIVALYQGSPGKNGVLCGELIRSLHELQQGIPETEVYERFGARTGLTHYKKLMALFISEKKRGSISLPDAMEKEMLEAWEEKKRYTRQQGEKIGTKLLLPMIGMLSVVFLMILVPAFMSFNTL